MHILHTLPSLSLFMGIMFYTYIAAVECQGLSSAWLAYSLTQKTKWALLEHKTSKCAHRRMLNWNVQSSIFSICLDWHFALLPWHRKLSFLQNYNFQSILIKVLIIYVWRKKFSRLCASFRKWLIHIFSVISGKTRVTYRGKVSVYLLQIGSAFLSGCSQCLLHTETN